MGAGWAAIIFALLVGAVAAAFVVRYALSSRREAQQINATIIANIKGGFDSEGIHRRALREAEHRQQVQPTAPIELPPNVTPLPDRDS